MLLSLGEICEYASASPTTRNFIEGEKLLHAGHILFCGKQPNECADSPHSLTAFCIQTSNMKKPPHEIKGQITRDGKIVFMECSCKAGLGGKCKHVLGVLLYCSRYNLEKLDNISCTDTKCLWKAPKEASLDKYKPCPLTEHECFQRSGPQQIKKLIISKEQEDMVANLLIQSSPSSALAKHTLGRHAPVYKVSSSTLINEDKSDVIMNNNESPIMENLSHMIFRPLRQCCETVIRRLSGNCVALCQETENSLASWKRERQFRITGSRCYSLYTYSKNTNPNWKDKSLKYFYPKSFTSQSTSYSILNEAGARKRYAVEKSVTVVQCGLVISKTNPYLAYSPDGIVFKDNQPFKLIEIKCPLAGKKATVSEILAGTKFLISEEGKFTLKKRHAYYGQIQMGMALLNLQHTDFVIYAPFDDSIEIITINFDEYFVKDLLLTLKTVYFNYMLHHVCAEENLIAPNKE